MTTQEELSQRLSQCPALMLQEVLTSNGIYTSDEATAQRGHRPSGARKNDKHPVRTLAQRPAPYSPCQRSLWQ